MEEQLTLLVGHYLVPLVEACGAFVVTLEVIRTVAIYVFRFFKRSTIQVSNLRIRLGRSMVMGLEFLVAADILKTALTPAWNDILLLAALIALRTVLNLLLEHELEMLNAKQTSSGDDDE